MIEASHLPYSAPKLPVPATYQSFIYTSLHQLNLWVCRRMYGVATTLPGPVPVQGPALIVCDHTSMGDPFEVLPGFGPAAEILLFRQKDPKPSSPGVVFLII